MLCRPCFNLPKNSIFYLSDDKVVDRIFISWLYVPSFNAAMFLGSSAVEQSAVNRLVGGSNPSRGAISQRTNLLPSPNFAEKAPYSRHCAWMAVGVRSSFGGVSSLFLLCFSAFSLPLLTAPTGLFDGKSIYCAMVRRSVSSPVPKPPVLFFVQTFCRGSAGIKKRLNFRRFRHLQIEKSSFYSKMHPL